MQQEVTISINDLLRFIWRGLLLSLVVAVITGFIVYNLSGQREPVFEARATIYTSQPQGFDIINAPRLDASTYKSAVTSDSVLGTALQSLAPEASEPSLSAIKALRSDTTVGVEEDRDSSLITIQVEDNTAAGAADKASALALAIVDWDRNRAVTYIDQGIAGLSAQIENIRNIIREMQVSGAEEDQIDLQRTLLAEKVRTLNNLEAQREATIPQISVLQLASPPSSPESPRPLFDATLAALLGVALTYGLLLLRNALDTRLRSVDDVAAVSGLPVIAEFPRLPKNVRNVPREASSYLRTNLLFSTMDANPKVVLITSANSGEGKSSIAISLAESFVRNGYRTLLVDADLRKPVIAGEYRINNIQQPSLEDCLKSPFTTHKAATVSIGAKDYLYVIPTFQPTPQASELLSRGFRECLDRWRQEYDVIIIDSAPVLAVADALTIAPLATGTLLTINQQKTDRRQVRATVELFGRIGVRLLGVAVTHVSKEASQQSRYSYGYGYSEEPVSTPQAQPSNPKDTLIDSPVPTVSRVNTKQGKQNQS